MFVDEPALAFEVVCFDPGRKTAEDGVLELEGLFF